MRLPDFWLAAFNNTARHWLGFFVPAERIFGLYVLSMVAIAWFAWRSRRQHGNESRGFFTYAFDRGVYGHNSARQDYVYFVGNGFIYYGVLAQLLYSERPFALLVHGALTRTFGPLQTPWLGAVASKVLFTIVYALLSDLASVLVHYAMHKLTVLWPFHEVHHSAEVLTPMTLFRMHPVDLLLSAGGVFVLTGAGIGLFGYLSGQQVTEYEVFGVNLIIFLFYLTGYNLRHSQIWVSYPRWLSRILVSPAQHQVHHSAAPQHKDRNFGFIFAFWDSMLGTSYVPVAYEDIEYGVTREERNPFRSVTALFVKPFADSAKAARVLMRHGSAKESAVLLAAIFGSFVCLREIKTIDAEPEVTQQSVYMEELTWPEIHLAVQAGYTTVIVPSGGTEQNGPHMVLGKHNVIIRATAGEIARRLGDALVAPVIAYVPEGEIGPPASGNMLWDGTIGVADDALEEVLQGAAASLRKQGFKYIFFLGDHGLSQKAQEEVSLRLASWRGEGVTVAAIGDYYSANGQVEWLKRQGYSEDDIGVHAGIRDTSEMLYLEPSGVRQN